MEGLNSVFVKKVWAGRYIGDIAELDSLVKKFNQEYPVKVKTELTPGLPSNYAVNLKRVKLKSDLKDPTVCFTRQVEEVDGKAYIRILKVPIRLAQGYLKQFVLAKLNVYQEDLIVYYEIEPGKLEEIKSLRFPIKYH